MEMAHSPDYTRDYIKRALTEKKIPVPDEKLANGTFDALMGLYYAHQKSGVQGAIGAWETLKMQRPELEAYHRITKLRHADRLRDLPNPKHITGKYPLYDGGFNVLFGPSAGGKSFVALDIASTIAIEHPVIYIAGEGLHGYAARWEAWKVHNGIPTAELYFYEEALQVMDDNEMLEFMDDVRSNHPNPALVIIDTMARSAVGLDENSSKEVGMFVSRVDLLRFQLGCSTLVVHHTGKSGSMRGSSALYGAADAVISVSKNDGVIKLTNNSEFEGKNKYGPEDWNMFYRLLPVSANGFDGAVLVETQQVIDDPSVEGNQLTDVQEEILMVLNDYQGATVTATTLVRTTDLTQATVYRNIKKLVKAGFVSSDMKKGIAITEAGKNALGVMDDE